MGGFNSSLGLLFEIDMDPSKAETALKQFQASATQTAQLTGTAMVPAREKVGAAATRAGDDAAQATGRTSEGIRQAQASAVVLEQQFGVHLPRAINTMLARSELIGPLLSAGFSVTILALFAENIGKVTEKIADTALAVGGYTAEVRSAEAEDAKATQQALTHFRTIATGQALIAQTNVELARLSREQVGWNEQAKRGVEAMNASWIKFLGPIGTGVALYKAYGASVGAAGEKESEAAKLRERLVAQLDQLNTLEIEANKTHNKTAAALGKEIELRQGLSVEERNAQAALEAQIKGYQQLDKIIAEMQALPLHFWPTQTQMMQQFGASINSIVVPAYTRLSEQERAQLPLMGLYDSALYRQFQNVKAVVDEIQLGMLPAFQRIEVQYQRQVNAATREINAQRQLYQQHKITRAEMENDERTYTNLVLMLERAREDALKREQLAQVQGTVIAAASLLQTLGFRRAAAITEAVWETAQGFAALGRYDFWSAAQHFISAAEYGVIAGQSTAGPGSAGVGTGTAPVSTRGPSPGGSAGGAATTPATLAPGSAGAAQQLKEEAPIQIIVHMDNSMNYGGPAGLDELGHKLVEPIAKHLNRAVTTRDVKLISSPTVNPAPVSRGRS